MALNKATWFFKTDTGYGWSETLYSLATDLTAVMTAAKNLLPFRVALQGDRVHCTYLRVSDDLVQRDSLIYSVPSSDTDAKNVPENPSDIPNTALLLVMKSGTLFRRSFPLRGIPDEVTQNAGERVVSAAYRTKLNAWIAGVKLQPWGIKALQAVIVGGGINDINQAGGGATILITTLLPHGLVANDPIIIRGLRGASGLAGRYRVFAAVSPTIFSIKTRTVITQWNGGGIVGKLGFALQRIDDVIISRITHRLTGRPFDSPHGRRRALGRA